MAAGYDPIVWTTEWVAHRRTHHVIEVDMEELWKKELQRSTMFSGYWISSVYSTFPFFLYSPFSGGDGHNDRQ